VAILHREDEVARSSDDHVRTTITLYPDGPMIVRGDIELAELGGEPVPTGRTVALCRCGRSALKPFCDGSHKRARALGTPPAIET
jgi:CDGSH-type Zn-finger protein